MGRNTPRNECPVILQKAGRVNVLHPNHARFRVVREILSVLRMYN